MRMMKNNNNETVMVIGIDHGYGNMKTATRCFPSGVARYDKEPIFHKLREREYNPELMRLYVVGGGGCMIQNFGEYDKSRVTIVRDICATAKGYEAMSVRKIQRNGGMLV